MMRNIPEERWPQPHCGGSLKSRIYSNSVANSALPV